MPGRLGPETSLTIAYFLFSLCRPRLLLWRQPCRLGLRSRPFPIPNSAIKLNQERRNLGALFADCRFPVSSSLPSAFRIPHSDVRDSFPILPFPSLALKTEKPPRHSCATAASR